MMSGTISLNGLGSAYIIPDNSCSGMGVVQMPVTPRSIPAAQVADEIIYDWQARGGMRIDVLRGLIIEALEKYD